MVYIGLQLMIVFLSLTGKYCQSTK